jgi:hypothetical protein
MAGIPHEQAYPNIAFRPRTLNWWARLTRVPAECVHLEAAQPWMASLIPDTLYLRGKAARRRSPARPEVSLCRACLLAVLAEELAAYPGRVVAFEPDAESFSQYFFVAVPDFEAAGLEPGVSATIERRLAPDDARNGSGCGVCSRPAAWLWLSRQEVSSLDDVGSLSLEPGLRLCATHGAQKLCRALEAIDQANLFYVNLPYGEAGAYVWI